MADFPQVIRPQSYNNGAGPQSGASDLMDYVKGTANHNTRVENAEAKLPDAMVHRDHASEMTKADK